MLQNTRLLITKELSKVNDCINRCLYNKDSIIEQIIQSSFQHQGKQLRPQLVLLVAGMLGRDITEKTRRGAALVSLLHHASIIHDDVIDEAGYRRYKKTVNTAWGNKLAVLLGDYVLASILRIAVENQDYDFLSMLTSTAQSMSEGEILQLMQAQEIELCEVTYLQIIQKKTASLLAASCAIGAMSVNATQEQVKIMYEIGEQLGMAFQLYDDLLDYNLAADTGKPKFMDLKSHILTLPLIYALQQALPPEKQHVLSLIRSYNTVNINNVQEILSFVNRLGGINYTLQKIASYQQTALMLTKQHLQTSCYRDLFIKLIQEIISPQ